ncbi:hypothetical protein Tco_0566171 [Tanacetum coccineum]
MTTLAEHIIVTEAENLPPMLEKSMMMLDSIDNGPLVYPTIEEDGQTRLKKYSELTEAQQLQDDCDVQATNIILHGLPPDVLSQLINDMHTIGMTMQQVQVNTKFLNALPLEWSKFVTDVKLAKSFYTTNYDQLYTYLSQHERHANELCLMRERYPNPLTLVANSQTLYNHSQSPQHSVSLFLHFSMEKIQFTALTKKWKSYMMWHQAFQTEGLEAYDSDCDDLSSAKAVLMANLSSCDSDVLSKVPYSDTYLNDMINQDVQQMTYSKQTHLDNFLDNEINSDSNTIPYSQYLQETQDAGIQDTNSSTPNDLLVLSLVEQMTDHVANLDKEN